MKENTDKTRTQVRKMPIHVPKVGIRIGVYFSENRIRHGVKLGLKHASYG